MRAISLWQPWATLLVCGRKTIETRHWPTNYRGPLLIHAAKRWTLNQRIICTSAPVYMALLDSGYSGAQFANTSLPLGKIIGIVEVTSCYNVNEGKDLLRRHFADNKNEPYFGDYSDGRFAWLTKNQNELEEPFEEKGRQGFWDVDESRLSERICRLYS